MNTRYQTILSLAFKAVALGMAAITIALTGLNTATPTLYVILIAIGLFCLTLASIINHSTEK